MPNQCMKCKGDMIKLADFGYDVYACPRCDPDAFRAVGRKTNGT